MAKKNSSVAIKNLLSRNVEQVIERAHLENALRSKKSLRVKLGIDPTSPDLHLGHAVVLRKLKEFQELGHKIVLIIGDFTGRIGDPSGRSEARKPLGDKEIDRNMRDYLAQAGKVIDVRRAEIHYNSEWFAREGVAQLIALAGAGSMQQILRRADFKKRLASDQDVTLLEMLYPLLQGYDSVKVAADVELGGNDQLFNLLMGRRVQRHFGQKEQDILTVSLLEGLDGAKKMSKSVGNYIGLTESPENMAGKTMAVHDSLVLRYFEMCTELPQGEIERLRKKLSPRDLKLRLAREIVSLYHGKAIAQKASERWEELFSKKKTKAEELPELKLSKKIKAVDLVLKSGVAKSKSEAWRLVSQGGLKVNESVRKDPRATLSFKGGEIAKIGKRHFFKINLSG